MKKRVCFVIIAFFLLGLYAARIYIVNTNIELPNRQVFEKNSVVPYETDYNISAHDRSEGYTIQVLDTEIVKAEEFGKKYDVVEMGIASYYYMIKVSVENVSNEHVEEEGVSLGIAMLIGTNYSIIASSEMFRAVNPDMPGMSFSLKTGTKKDVWLVFQLIPGGPEYQGIKKDPPMLQITQYPNQKLIKLS